MSDQKTNPLHNPHGTIFGLMDKVYGPGTAQALQYTSGPFEMYGCDGWESLDAPSWADHIAYRIKPQPPKPREFWVDYDKGRVLPYVTDDDGSFKEHGYIHVVEVLP